MRVPMLSPLMVASQARARTPVTWTAVQADTRAVITCHCMCPEEGRVSTMTFTSATDPDLKLTVDAHQLLPGAAFILRVTDPQLWGDRDLLGHCAATIREGLGEDTRFVIIGPELEVYIVGRVA